MSPIKRKVREKSPFPFLGGGERGGEAFGWTETYLFLYLIGKRAYISNLGPIKHKVREILQFSLFGWGGRGVEAFGWTETYLFVCLIGKRPYILNLSPIERKVREKWQFSLFGWGKGERKPPDGAETNFSVNYMYIGTHMQRIK